MSHRQSTPPLGSRGRSGAMVPWWAACVTAAWLVAAGCDHAAAAAPNILLIVSEDNGPELGCYGDPFVKTPRLDALAAEGVRFDRAYVAQAGCSPSRASFLTGLYPHEHGQLGLATWGFRLCRPEIPNMVRSLGEAGYRTGLIGKLHVNPEDAFPFDMQAIGNGNFARKDLAGYARHAAEFFAADERPFFLSVNYPDAHGPWLRQVDGLPPDPLGADDVVPLPAFGIDTPQLREAMANYYNCLMRLDTLVGHLLDALEQSGKAHDTLVVYIGDHGADMLRGKRTCYEGGLRIPLIVRWPGHAEPGQVRDELVSTIDLFPTFLAAAAADPLPHLRGRSLLPLLEGGAHPWRTHLFAEYHTHAARENFYPQRSVRDARYKLIENLLPGEENPGVAYTFREFDSGPAAVEAAGGSVKAAYDTMRRPPRYELYDLAADPHEFTNLAADPTHAAPLASLTAHLAAWRSETADPLLDDDLLARFAKEVRSIRTKKQGRDHEWDYPDSFRAHDAAASESPSPASSSARRPNVLFISIDDLRPALGCYGDPLAKTPAIDRLAASSRCFLAAYCSQAVCGPSRTAVFTGCRPDSTRVWHNRHRFRDHCPDLVTLPQLFKQAGYHTQGIGKTFSGDEREEDPASWSVPATLRVSGSRSHAARENTSGDRKGPPSEAADVADDGYPDGRLADLAIETLTRLRDREQPFFLAVGFLKPHLPFNAPKRYWDLHERAAFLPQEPSLRTADAPDAAFPDHRELAGYGGIPRDEQLSAKQIAELRHGYYACASYVDAQVGRLLEAIVSLGLAEDTIVVLWGDHGYSLGEGDHWCKATNFERDTRVPLLIHVPGIAAPGQPTEAIVELVDLYPTLAALAGLTPPDDLDGASLVPILDDPSAQGRDLALSQYARPWKKADPQLMGYSVRSPTHRYTRWISWPDGPVVAEELYDYGRVAGPRDGSVPFVESRNRIDDPAMTTVRDQLRRGLDEMLAGRGGPPTAAASSIGITEPTILFRQATDGVHTFRIPGIVVTAQGTVLAWCEARRFTSADRGEIEIHLRRSTDGGRTWEPARQVAHLGQRLPRNPHVSDEKKRRRYGGPDEQTVHNAVAIATRDGRVHLLYGVEYMRGFHLVSDDDGQTWSPPREITSAVDGFRDEIDWQVMAFGPGHGIETTDGRLVVPVWMSDYREPAVRPRPLTHAAGVLVSSDGGTTWQAGSVAVRGGESNVVERGDGRLLLTARNGDRRRQRLAATSDDGGLTWSPPWFIDDLPEYGCMAGAVRHPGTAAEPGPLLLHSAPDTDDTAHTARRDVTVWLSRDDGLSWPTHRRVQAGPSAYSDLAVLPDGSVLCIYESGLEGVGPQDGKQRDWAYAAIAVTRFDLDWLVSGEPDAHR